MTKSAEVVVIGAGLAGLSAARGLVKAGLSVELIEASSEIGGRIRTENFDGFQLDHGFQLFNPAYPAARKVLNINELELRKFSKGIRILLDNEIIQFGTNPSESLNFIKNFNRTGLINLARYLLLTLFSGEEKRKSRADLPAYEILQNICNDDQIINQILIPFLSGVFLEKNLNVSRHWLDEVLRYFVLGSPGIPRYGMQQIPMQLSRGVTEFISLNTKVESIDTGVVNTSTGIRAPKYIVLAADPVSIASLLGLPMPKMNSVITWYFTISHRYRGSRTKLLAIDGSSNPGPLINSAVLTDVAKSYAPRGQDLVCGSALSDNFEDIDKVKNHIALMHTLNPAHLNFLKSFRIDNALPETGYLRKLDLTNFKEKNIYIASDLISTPSINGAVSAGQEAADQIVLKELRS